MSTLWTPRGEVPIDDRPSAAESADAARSAAGSPTASVDDGDAFAPAAGTVGEPGELDLDDLSPEERAQAEQYIRELAEARQRLKETPAAAVVANHALGLYELAALHLSDQTPNFTEAAIAIDALGALLDGMKGKLGEPETTLRDSLTQLRMAFVQLKNRPTDTARHHHRLTLQHLGPAKPCDLNHTFCSLQ